jgi:hypothetical protein
MAYVERLKVEYPKPKRFPMGANLPEDKEVLTQKEIRHLMMGEVLLEEKMDGTPKEIITQDPQLFVFTEDLRRMHSIFYHLPGRFAIYDIFSVKRDVFVSIDEKEDLCKDIRKGRIRVADIAPELMFQVPCIAIGNFTVDELPQFLGLSAYASQYPDIRKPAAGEGLVVKSPASSFPEEYQPGKIVRSEFTAGIVDNYMKKSFRKNVIDPREPVILDHLAQRDARLSSIFLHRFHSPALCP